MTFPIEQEQLRPALGATVGLGMETPVVRSSILTLTTGTHLKGPQAGAYPVIGQATADRVAWSAIGAIGERVTPATAARVEHLHQTVAAHRGVVSDHRRCPSTTAIDDHETLSVMRCGNVAGDHRIHACQRRRVLLQACDEMPDLRRCAVDLDFDTARVIAHPAGKTKFPSQPPHEGTKADALHHSADADVLTDHTLGHVKLQRPRQAAPQARRCVVAATPPLRPSSPDSRRSLPAARPTTARNPRR